MIDSFMLIDRCKSLIDERELINTLNIDRLWTTNVNDLMNVNGIISIASKYIG